MVKFIDFNGKEFAYTNQKQVMKKFGLPNLQQTSQFIHENGRRIILLPGNETDIINIKNEFKGYLKRNFDIKRTPTVKLIKGDNVNIKNITIVGKDGLGPGSYGKYRIEVIMYIYFGSGEAFEDEYVFMDGKVINRPLLDWYVAHKTLEIRKIKKDWSGLHTNSLLDNFVYRNVISYGEGLGTGRIVFYKKNILTSRTHKKLFFKDGWVRDKVNEFELTEWLNIQYNETNGKGNSCIVNMIKNKFPNNTKLHSDILKYETEHGIKLDDFLIFCTIHNLCYRIYDEHGKLLMKHIIKDRKGVINAIIYNNHIYPLSGGIPKRRPQKEYLIKYIDNSKDKLKELFENKILPSRIIINNIIDPSALEEIVEEDVIVTSFVVKNIKYIQNPDYKKSLDIFNKIKNNDTSDEKEFDDLPNMINDKIKLDDIIGLLEKYLKYQNVTSFIPEKIHFKTDAFQYSKGHDTGEFLILDDGTKIPIVTIDKNKAYIYALYILPYLIKFDYRIHKIIKNPEKISQDHYLYIVQPKEVKGKINMLLPGMKLYPGYFLKECEKEGCEFTLVEELETEMVDNYYRKIINLLYKNMDEKDFKTIFVHYIGRLERNEAEKMVYEYIGFKNDESAQMYDGFSHKIGDQNLMFDSKKIIIGVTDRLPINIQIKDMARFILYKKIKDLKIPFDRIVKINTDSISYYGKLPNDLDRTTLEGWKKEEYHPTDFIDKLYPNNLSAKNITNPNPNPRILHKKYAGCGKTYYIINELIPRLISNNITYIVLTPTHPSLQIYIDHGLNCCIMQKYTFDNSIPSEDYIIIDEIGFVDSACHELLYKINKMDKSYECFGDFDQLQPVGGSRPYNQPHYLKYMFNEIITTFVNRRNNFTKEYYDQLINMEIPLIKEVNKWSVKNFYETDNIICYRHETKRLYDEKMLKYLNYKRWNMPGVKIQCKTNALLDKDIYNKKEFKIKSITKNGYELIDNKKKIFKINKRQLKSHFEMGYAKNIHQTQGLTLKSYYWCPEDNYWLQPKNCNEAGNIAYVIISRLSQKII